MEEVEVYGREESFSNAIGRFFVVCGDTPDKSIKFSGIIVQVAVLSPISGRIRK